MKYVHGSRFVTFCCDLVYILGHQPVLTYYEWVSKGHTQMQYQWILERFIQTFVIETCIIWPGLIKEKLYETGEATKRDIHCIFFVVLTTQAKGKLHWNSDIDS